MLRDSAVALIKGRLQRKNFSDLDALIVSEMQAVQEELESAAFLPWFLLSEKMTVTRAVSTNDDRLALPTGFLKEYEEGSLWLQTTDSENPQKAMQKGFYDIALKVYPGTGTPKVYALDGDYFRLRPEPDEEETFYIKVYKKDTVLSTNIENKWLANASGWFMAEVAYKMAALYLKDAKAANIFAAEVKRQYATIYKKHIARMEANMDEPMGGYDG